MLRDIPVTVIHSINRKRALDAGKVAELAHSIANVGLLNPITVRAVNSHYELIAGAHRLEAFRLLNKVTIPAQLFEGDELGAELAEIDENLKRNDLTVLEQGEHLQRRNEILEEMGQRAKAGDNQYQSGGVTPDTTSVNEPKTTTEVAAEAGMSERSAQRRTQVAKSLLPEVKEFITGYDIADNLTQLLELARVKKDDQLEIAKLIVSGDAKDVKTAKKKLKSTRTKETREELAEAGRELLPPDDIQLFCGDFRELGDQIPDNSIDLIFTDPPYDKKSIPLYGDLAKFAARVLKPGGSLIAYVGHYAIGEVYNLMSEHLRFWWLLGIKHSGASRKLVGVNVIVEWKPLVWFVKGTRYGNEFVRDMLTSDAPNKTEHEWQQGHTEADYYIEHLTDVDGVILDPFAGSGTTLISASKLGRKSIGYEIDEERFNVAKHNITDKTGL